MCGSWNVYFKMNTDKIFLDVRIHKVNRLIILAKNEIDDPSILVGKIFHEFEITSNEWVNFKFRNNLGSPVNVEDLPELILQKKNSGSFFIELVLEKSPLTFRSESIQNYLKTLYPSEYQNILDEAKLLDGALSKKNEKLVTDGLFSYIIETFSINASQSQITDCCQSLVELFPFMKTSSNDGIDSLYNPTIKKGVIFHKLRNAKSAESAAKRSNFEEKAVISSEDLKTKLKYCVVKNDKSKLKEILRETVEVRRQLLKKNEPEYKDFWLFYFIDTDLILYDFQLQFEHIKHDALEIKWEALHDKPLSEFKDAIDLEKIPTTDIHVWQFITTFMSLKPRGDFWKILQTLIVFDANPQAEPMLLMDSSYQKPQIIAISSVHKSQIKFYISVRGFLISVPKTYSIIGTLDLVYKLHKIFDIEPHSHVKRLMGFLDYFVYGFEEAPGAIDDKMHELGDKLIHMEI